MSFLSSIFGRGRSSRDQRSSTNVAPTSMPGAPPNIGAPGHTSYSRSAYPAQRINRREAPLTFRDANGGSGVSRNVASNTTTTAAAAAGGGATATGSRQQVIRSSIPNNSSNNNTTGFGVTNNANGTAPIPPNTSRRTSVRSSGPGAYSVGRSEGVVYRVTVPEGITPGQEFQVVAGTQLVRVRCPTDSGPGSTLQITVPGAAMEQRVAGGGFTSHASNAPPGQPLPPNPLITPPQQPQQQPQPQRLYYVTIPPNITPGQTFFTLVDGQRVEVTCPPDAREGMQVRINIPPPPSSMQHTHLNQHPHPPTATAPSFMSSSNGNANGTNFFSTPNIVQPQPQQQQGQQQEFIAADNSSQLFPPPSSSSPQQQQQLAQPSSTSTSTNGNPPQYTFTPQMNMNGMQQPPQQPPQQLSNNNQNNNSNNSTNSNTTNNNNNAQMQTFEVTLPPGVQPGQPFALMAGGRRVLVTAPQNVQPGDRVRFQLPLSATSMNNVTAIRLSYGQSTGWTRTLKLEVNGRGVKFQWVNLDEDDERQQHAYVRHMQYYMPPGEQHRTAYVTLIPAKDSIIPGNVYDGMGEIVVSYQNLVGIQAKKLDNKAEWLQQICRSRLAIDYAQGHMRINVRRAYLLADSVDAIMSLTRTDLRKTFRFEFWNEPGIDAGGLTREWFHLVTNEIFNPDFGLWQYSSANQMCLMINPASEMSHPNEHLTYFRFLGRVLGKALFERQLVNGHMVRHLYKHLLGFPVNMDDIEMVDNSLFSSLEKLMEYKENGGDVKDLALDFSVREECMGFATTKDLIPGGADIDVTNDNLAEYIDAIVKYQLLERTRPQVTELILGFYDVIEEGLLTVFDFQELELLVCGLPRIDLQDWQKNTEYTGRFENVTESTAVSENEVIQWFWSVVEQDFDVEMRARLLQFVTGTSGVPAQGFSVLQGNDGNIRKFTIHGVELEMYVFPRAHTCFNRIDLPLYTSRGQLLEKLKLAVQMEATGFGIE